MPSAIHLAAVFLCWLAQLPLSPQPVHSPGLESTDEAFSASLPPEFLLRNLHVPIDEQSPQAAPGAICCLIAERDQGRDLNADADHSDFVIFLYSRSSASPINLGLAVSPLSHPLLSENFLAFSVGEPEQGNSDLNGDADALDSVVFVYDLHSHSLRNLHVATAFEDFTIYFPWLAFSADEASQGSSDLNGDGDALDPVIHLFDATSGEITNLALAGSQPVIFGTNVAVAVSEFLQGNHDLNSDSDSHDWVLHISSIPQLRAQNTGLAVILPLTVSQSLLAFLASEFSQAGDLNADGDTTDYVLFVYEQHWTAPRNLGLASGPPAVHFPLVAFTVSESLQGRTDRNGDGDLLDSVAVLFDVRTEAVVNLGLATRAFHPTTDGHLVALSVNELDQARTDRNGDSDAFDDVAAVYDSALGTVVNLGLALPNPNLEHEDVPITSQRLVAFLVSEQLQGVDLNGDGDTSDFLPHLFDGLSQISTTIPVSCDRSLSYNLRLVSRSLVFLASELRNGPTDFNQDGDQNDVVMHVYNLTSRRLANLRLAADYSYVASRDLIALGVPEPMQGNVDLNGDGDTADVVLFSVVRDMRRTCAFGTVGLSSGAPVPVLSIGGNSRYAAVRVGDPLTVALASSPLGPDVATYILWVWPDSPTHPTVARWRDRPLGCTVNPSPLSPPLPPQPILCLVGSSPVHPFCEQMQVIPFFQRAPWLVTLRLGRRARGLFTIQGIIEDAGSAAGYTLSVTNACVLRVY